MDMHPTCVAYCQYYSYSYSYSYYSYYYCMAYRSRRLEEILDLLPSLGALVVCSSDIRLGEEEG